jgi:4-alpha-glucanotransferase
MHFQRSSGILLHPTSLPGNYGIGTLGKEAFAFIDFLITSRQKLWQLCPLGPTGYGDSPYQCFSAFAGNPLLIDFDVLLHEKLISKADLPGDDYPDDHVDFGWVYTTKYPVLRKAFENFKSGSFKVMHAKFDNFCEAKSQWLDDYALFMALKGRFDGHPWEEWDDDIRKREDDALHRYKSELAEEIAFQKFMQFLFFQQWLSVKAYANANGIKIIGDIPIFVSMDSADAWSNPENFQFDEDLKPTAVAGVPPDYFSETGQLWGNPLYDWEKMANDGFSWWVQNIKSKLELYDIIRIDHFRGFAAYWSVPADETTAINGSWVPTPGYELFNTVKEELGSLPIIAEDLGVITPDVEALRDHFEFPGMKILQFAFNADEYDNLYLTHNYSENSVVYTGSHDNNTLGGWVEEIRQEDLDFALEYVHGKTGSQMHWDFIRAAFSSTAVMAVIPLQDVLGLPAEARMNTPGTASGNWQWRFSKSQMKDAVAAKLGRMTRIYGR